MFQGSPVYKIDVQGGLRFTKSMFKGVSGLQNRCPRGFRITKSMSEGSPDYKIDVQGVSRLPNRCSKGPRFTKSMSEGFPCCKIDVQGVSTLQNRCPMGFQIAKSMSKGSLDYKIDGANGIWYIDFWVSGTAWNNLGLGWFWSYFEHWFSSWSPKLRSMYQMGSGTLKTFILEVGHLSWFRGSIFISMSSPKNQAVQCIRPHLVHWKLCWTWKSKSMFQIGVW